MSESLLQETEYFSEHFSGLDLLEAELCNKEFEACVFTDCDLSQANLADSKFIDCHFVRCNLSVVKIKRARFSEVVFESCKVIGVDWTHAYWPAFLPASPIKFYKCIINDSSFFALDQSELVIEECKAHDVDFREGNFSHANFSHTDFSHSSFRQTNLSNVDFSEASNYQIDIYVNEIKRAKFTRQEAISLLESLDIELVD